MKHGYAVMGLVLVVVVLTGFVLNTQQAPTRWEYATFGYTSDTFFWESEALRVSGASAALVEAMGCQPKRGWMGVLYCAGETRWEFVASIKSMLLIEGMDIGQLYLFKRPVR